MIDAILRLPERLPQEFSQGLVCDSVRFVLRFKPAQIDLILQKLMSRRTEPGIPRATEMAFSNLDVVLHLLDLPEMGNYERMSIKEESENQSPALERSSRV